MIFHHWALPRMPSSRDGIRKADMCGPTFYWISRWFLANSHFDIQLSDLFLMIAKLSSLILSLRIFGFTGLAITFSSSLR
ncbi:hypothetical protein C6Y08_19925 [Lactiplantibacillus pentosus]|uniref:Uncharacterized protein n=1 Tax=Lactiplantibacillus pentosus TaxID=1589 RepID=A0ABD7IK74_LACPE|nr:hypothetical protein C6Y08_19925 [Lactiplantibacillus pentosus]RMW41877.1 hypothetical protein D6U18_17970 [Lactiplantibacillus pentosus]